MDEKENIFRIEKAERPEIDATILLKRQINKIIFFCDIINSKVIGIIFWTVKRIKQFIQESDSIIERTQNWKGNIPIFIKSLIKINVVHKLFERFLLNIEDIIILEKIIIDEILWIRK